MKLSSQSGKSRGLLCRALYTLIEGSSLGTAEFEEVCFSGFLDGRALLASEVNPASVLASGG